MTRSRPAGTPRTSHWRRCADGAKAYDPDLLALLEAVVGADTKDLRVTEIPLLGLRAGMMLVEDVRSVAGPLLIARGHVATEQLVTRLWNLGEGYVREPLLVAEALRAVPDRVAPR